MTANRGLFIRNNGNVGTTPIEGRLVLASLVAENVPGVPRNGLLDQKVANLVTGSASSMSYNVGPCTPVINRAAGEGVYMFTLTGTSSVATDAAPGTGSRYDLIYVKQNDLDKGDAVNTASLSVWKGTAAASPTKPYADLPAGAYVLAEALVQAGAANTADAKVTITQVWRYTTLRGAPIPVRNGAERDEITATALTSVRRLDLGPTAVETYNGTAWSLSGAWQHAEYISAAVSGTPAGSGILYGAFSQDASCIAATFNNTFVKPGPSAGRIQILETGLYTLENLYLPSGAVAACQTSIYNETKAKGIIAGSRSGSYGSTDFMTTANDRYLEAGDVISFSVASSAGNLFGSRIFITKTG